MRYCIVVDGIITNIIICENDVYAERFNAIPAYDGATIGTQYNPPEPTPTPVPSVWDELAEAYKKGVQSAYDE